MAKCHPTPFTHPYRKEGEKIPPPHQLGEAGSRSTLKLRSVGR